MPLQIKNYKTNDLFIASAMVVLIIPHLFKLAKANTLKTFN